MNTQELLRRGGRIVRERRGRRVVTIAYYREGDELVYGATIFRQEDSSDQWSKSLLREHAIERLVTNPVRVHAPDNRFNHLGAQDHFVRGCLVDFGCQSRD